MHLGSLHPDDTTIALSGAAWSVDASSGIAVPADSTEWTAFLASAGLSGSVVVPDALWLFQEASGNLADSVGSFTLTASGTGASYQQSVTGWARKAITWTDGATAAFTSTSASLPNIASASVLTLVLGILNSSPAGNRFFCTQGTTTTNRLMMISTPRFRARSGASNADGAATPAGSVRPYGLRTNRTAGSAVGFSNVDKLTPTWNTGVTGKSIVLGDASAAPPMSILYAAQWHNANAEISDANYKALLQAMGFTITWS